MKKEIHEKIDRISEGLQFGKIILTFDSGEVIQIDRSETRRERLSLKEVEKS